MFLQIPGGGEALATFTANVLLHPVGEHVLIKISQQAKGFVADFALVWFLFTVSRHVSF